MQFEWKSENIDQIAAALSKAQGEMEPAIKDRNNPAFKSKYADLAGVWEAMGPPLAKHGLALVQLPFPGDGGIVLRTVLMHTSGQWLLSDLFMAPDLTNAQKVGGAITYMRRYAASAMCGVYQDDDDGNTAVGYHGGAGQQGGGYPRGNAPRPAPAPEPAPRALYDPAADDRPIEKFVADAAARLLKPATTLYKDVVREAVSAGYAEAVPLVTEEVIDIVKHLDRTRKEWVRKTVVAIVKEAQKPAA